MMKRKFALFLAAAMVMVQAPTTLLAASSNNSLSKSRLSVPNYTLFYETGVVGSSGGAVTDNSDKIEYWIDGSNLIIELNNDINNGMTGSGTFKIELENAEWFFRTNTANTFNFDATSDGTVVGDETKEDTGISFVTAEKMVDNYAPAIELVAGAEFKATSEVYQKDWNGTGLPAGIDATYDQTKGIYADGKYFRLPQVNTDEASYLMQINQASKSTATVVVLGGTKAKNKIIVPLVVLTGGDESEVRVSITDSGTSIATSSFLLAQGTQGRTKTTVSSAVTSRTDFELKEIIIDEQRIGSIKPNAAFELVAPGGYYFDKANTAEVYTQLGLTWQNGKAGIGDRSIDPPDYTMEYKETNGKTDKSVIKVTLPGIRSSTNVPGELYIKGLMLVSEDNDYISTGDELKLRIRDINGSNNRSITDEEFLVGRVSDYAVSLKRVNDKIPELISGRLDAITLVTSTGHTSESTLSDDVHKAAVVRVEEAIPNAWWAERTTEFSLPEDVKVIKARFTNIENLVDDSKTALAGGGGADEYYYNTGVRENGVVTIKNNIITISRLNVKDNAKRAKFDLSLWLTMAANFEGDIDLVLSGSAVTNESDVNSVTIAKALRPINVETTVSDIKVGYQYISVGDFDIIETKAGNLQQGKSVYLSVTDEISVDMSIAKGFVAQVSDGNLKISNVITGSALGYTGENIDGQVKFDIDRASTQASTISFTNVQVKVDRNVPYSNLSNENDRGINLVVWGPAVAQNYEGLIGSISKTIPSSSKFSTRDFFDVPGVKEKYINVTTAATGENNQFSNVVRVTIGNPVIKISDQDFTMPVAAYVSTASNSTMVPVRFVANALGLTEEKVKWDDKSRTVTVDAGTRIVQFQIGNTNYLANGVSVPMTSPEGLPVAAEITNERAFVPFRALGDAFNITVTWDQPTSTAIYNAPIQQ